MKWIAYYKDGSSLEQFAENGESLFGDIVQEKLSTFKIEGSETHITVDLNNGVFFVDGKEFQIDGLSHRDEEYRLIYFRRVSINIGTRSIDAQRTTRHFIGYQITIDGVNKKVMLSFQNGKFQIKIE